MSLFAFICVHLRFQYSWYSLALLAVNYLGVEAGSRYLRTCGLPVDSPLKSDESVGSISWEPLHCLLL